jgi:Short C-terminal domain
LLWAIEFGGVFLYLLVAVTLGIATLRNGHGWMFFFGLFFPVLWIFGAFMQPTERAAPTYWPSPVGRARQLTLGSGIQPGEVSALSRAHPRAGYASSDPTRRFVPMFMRRRPLARAAVVGGAAYYGGKRHAESQAREADEQARIEDLEAQQYAAPPAAAPASGGMSEDSMAKLKQLAELHEQGILTDAEFEVQKEKILQSGV